MSLGILLCCVSMWICGSMSTGIVSVLACLALFVLGVQPSFVESVSGFTQPTVWFVLGVFCMTAFMQHSTLGLRLTRRFVLWGGHDSKKLVLAIMLVTAICSMMMTDTGAVALAMSFAIPLLETIGAKKGSNLGKCLLIGICVAACIGGFTTPCGHSLNVLALGLLQQTTGETVGFVAWMCYGVPLAAFVLPIAWLSLVKTFPPESISPEKVDQVVEGHFNVGGFSAKDVKCLVMMALMVSLWVASNWITAINTTAVALLGMVMLFVPGMNILTWHEFEKEVGWNLFLFFGGVLSIGAAIQSTGAAQFIATTFLNSGIMDMPVVVSLIVVSLFVYVVLSTLIPIAPAWTAIFLPPLVLYAQSVGLVSFAPVFVLVSLLAGSYLMPLCPAMSMTFDSGYYRFGDMAKSGWLSSVALVVGCALWVYLLGGVVGLM